MEPTRMVGLSHIVLHVALCKAVTRLPAQTSVDLRVVMAYRVREPEMDRTFRFVRGDEDETTVEYDAPQGVYRLQISLPKQYGCSDVEYLTVLPDHDREISATLRSGISTPITPAIVAGAAPPATAYLHPTVVLVDKSVACGKDVGTPVTDGIDIENVPDAYYAKVTSPAILSSPAAHSVALRLTDASGGYHYVRVPLEFPPALNGWPTYQRLDVTTDFVDYVATQPEDTLLCPKIFRTTAG
ncbi:MAG: hypothetical protein ACXWNK_13735 [Vulcanimicrobiaceae bacterium]